MKFALALAIATGALWTANTAPGIAQSDPYRWCAELGGGSDSYTNCYFVTLTQCEAAVRGVGGFCRHNHFYTGPKSADETAEAAPRRADNNKRTTPR